MPELPEVETIKGDLQELVMGRRLQAVEVRDARLVRYPDVQSFVERVQGARIESVRRRAKYLLLSLSTGYVLAIQLMVTGQFLLVEPRAPLNKKATRLVFDLDDGRQLRLVDSSFFARMSAVSEEELTSQLHLDELGPEALDPDLTLERFRERLRRRRGLIKPLLLDQRFVAGLGNIYADEALFAARISPFRTVSSLTDEEVAALYGAIRRILPEAIRLRGTTTRSYRDVLGRKGSYQTRLLVHARTGQPCAGCAGVVQCAMIAGRAAYYCAACQE